MREFELKVNDNDALLGRAWEVKKPIANVVIFQGMEEYGLRYLNLVNFLNDNSINVYALDCYGQGLNAKEDLSMASIWPENGFNKMVDAHHMMVEEAKKNGLKTYVFAHSMGSFMCQYFIQKYPGCVDKVVMCGSGSKKPGLPIAIAIATIPGTGRRKYHKAKAINNMMFGGFNNKIKNPRTPYDWLSYNEENVDSYINDKYCGFGPTNNFCYQFLKFMNSLFNKKRLSNIRKDQKIFLIAGEEDPVTNYGKCTQEMYDLYNKLGIKDVRKKIYTHARHEIIAEACKDEVFKDVLDFYLK